MDKPQNPVVRDPERIVRAKCRMVLWLLFFYFLTLTWAYLTFPFLGVRSSSQNVLHGILVASPFWTAALAALVKTRRPAGLSIRLQERGLGSGKEMQRQDSRRLGTGQG